MFTRKTISAMPRQRSYFFKYLTMFFLGASAVMLATQAFDISTSLTNAVQYINKIIITSNGTNSGTTGVVIDGANGGRIGIGTDTPTTQLQINGMTGSIKLYHIDLSSGYEMSTVTLNADRNDTTGGLQILDTYLRSAIGNIKDPLKLYAGNTGYIYIATGGNIGIGTTSPSKKLEIYDGGSITFAADFGDSYVRFNGDPSGNTGLVIGQSVFDIGLINNPDGVLQLSAGSNALGGITITTAGRVGIATSNPGAALEVSGNILLTTGGYIATRTQSNQLYLSNGGKVGISTSNPSAMLTVNGGIKPKSLSSASRDICNTDAADYPEGTIFYNITDHYLCYCNAGGSSVRVGGSGTISCY